MNLTALLAVLQFGDSLLPVGAFSFSNGLEAAVQQGVVHDKETLHQFVLVAVRQSAGLDGIALLEAHRAAAAHDLVRIRRADGALFNRKLNEEMRSMTVRMDKKLAELAAQVCPTPLLVTWLEQIQRAEAPGTYAVCLGLLLAELGLAQHDAFAVHQYGVANMILSASLRLMKIDHLDTQTILFQVNSRAQAEYENIMDAALDDMASFTPLMDVLAAAHVKAHVRMFMN